MFFVAPEGVILSALVNLGEEFEAGIPGAVFQAPLRQTLLVPYNPTADGSRFVVNVTRKMPASRPLTLVQNWPATVSGS